MKNGGSFQFVMEQIARGYLGFSMGFPIFNIIRMVEELWWPSRIKNWDLAWPKIQETFSGLYKTHEEQDWLYSSYFHGLFSMG